MRVSALPPLLLPAKSVQQVGERGPLDGWPADERAELAAGSHRRSIADPAGTARSAVGTGFASGPGCNAATGFALAGLGRGSTAVGLAAFAVTDR